MVLGDSEAKNANDARPWRPSRAALMSDRPGSGGPTPHRERRKAGSEEEGGGRLRQGGLAPGRHRAPRKPRDVGRAGHDPAHEIREHAPIEYGELLAVPEA